MGARIFIVTLPSGICEGNTRGLRQCQKEGWSITARGYQVRYEPRSTHDPRPWTDGAWHYRALDCAAVPNHRSSRPR